MTLCCLSRSLTASEEGQRQDHNNLQLVALDHSETDEVERAALLGPLSGIEAPVRLTVTPDAKLPVSREEAAQLLSICQRGTDYLNRRLPTRRGLAEGFLTPVADLRKYARVDHPVRIVVSARGKFGVVS